MIAAAQDVVARSPLGESKRRRKGVDHRGSATPISIVRAQRDVVVHAEVVDQNPLVHDVALSIQELRAQVRARNALLKFEISNSNMVKSIARQMERDPNSYPVDFAAKEFKEIGSGTRKRRKQVEKIVIGLTTQLPAAAWWQSHRGLGLMGLGQIIAITGDLHNFSNPSKLWKFMSLHVIDGKASRRIKGSGSKGQQFSPARRTIMHQIGEAIMKLNKGAYRKLYEDRKVFELAKIELDVRGRVGWAHKRSLRYLEKRVLRDLWRQWRKKDTETIVDVPGLVAPDYPLVERF